MTEPQKIIDAAATGCGREYSAFPRKSLIDSFTENDSDSDSDDGSDEEDYDDDDDDRQSNCHGKSLEARLGILYRGVEQAVGDTVKMFSFSQCAPQTEKTDNASTPRSIMPPTVSLSRQRSILSNLHESWDAVSVITNSERASPSKLSTDVSFEASKYGLDEFSKSLDISNKDFQLGNRCTEDPVKEEPSFLISETETGFTNIAEEEDSKRFNAAILNSVSQEPTLLGVAKEIGEGLLLRTRSSPELTTRTGKVINLKRSRSFDGADLSKVAVAMKRLSNHSSIPHARNEPTEGVKKRKKKTTGIISLPKVLFSITEEDCDSSEANYQPEKAGGPRAATLLGSQTSLKTAENSKAEPGERNCRKTTQCSKRNAKGGVLGRLSKQVAMPHIRQDRHREDIQKQSAEHDTPSRNQRKFFSLFSRATKKSEKFSPQDELILFEDSTGPLPALFIPDSNKLSIDRYRVEANVNNDQPQTNVPAATRVTMKPIFLGKEVHEEDVHTNAKGGDKNRKKKRHRDNGEKKKPTINTSKTKPRKTKSNDGFFVAAARGEKDDNNPAPGSLKMRHKGWTKEVRRPTSTIFGRKKTKDKKKNSATSPFMKSELNTPRGLECTSTEETWIDSSFDVLGSHSSLSFSLRESTPKMQIINGNAAVPAVFSAPKREFGRRPDPEGRLIPLEEC
jgi:hypothetical protein